MSKIESIEIGGGGGSQCLTDSKRQNQNLNAWIHLSLKPMSILCAMLPL